MTPSFLELISQIELQRFFSHMKMERNKILQLKIKLELSEQHHLKTEVCSQRPAQKRLLQ